MMPNEWPTMTLRDAGVSLIDCVHKTPTAVSDGYAYVAIPQIANGRIDFSTARRISEYDFIIWTKKARPQAWDVVLSRRCNPGETAHVVAGEEFAVGQNLVLLRANGKVIYPPFLRWLTRSPEWWVQIQKNLNVGAVFDSLKCADVPNFELRVPPLQQQKEIAATLGSLDDKIEQNRRTGRALEGLARAVFKAWFMDFEPVKAKAAGATSFPGMPAAAFAALPDRLVDSELGPIPEGWSNNSIKDRASIIQYGLTTSASTEQVGPHFLRITDIRGGAVEWSAVPYCVASESDIRKYRIADGDIVVARTGASTGDNLYIIEPPEAVFASYLVRFQFADREIGRIVGEFMRTDAYQSFVAGSIGGSAQPNANAQTLAAAVMAFPQMSTAKAYFDLVRPFDLKRAADARESRKLAELRDYLLPRLLSGKVRVR